MEVILVNDGSVDNSVEICNEFVREDSRFTLINQKIWGRRC
ncbi:glycosyltransferase [Enterococcus faecium]|nr:glycosyltransferase [Enterococcus faecium]